MSLIRIARQFSTTAVSRAKELTHGLGMGGAVISAAWLATEMFNINSGVYTWISDSPCYYCEKLYKLEREIILDAR